MIQAVLMASGGMDSTVLAWWLRDRGVRFQPLFIDYGQTFVATEWEFVRGLMPPDTSPVHVGRLGDFVAESPSVLIRGADLWKTQITAHDLLLPYRNLLILTAGAAYASSIGASALYSAFINSNHAQEVDATLEFLTATGMLFESMGSVKIEMPFREMSKAEVAQIGVSVGAPIERTYSCQVQGRTHCGACPNCVDRTIALASVS